MTLTVKVALSLLVIGAGLVLFIVSTGLTNFDLSSHLVESHHFDAGDDNLSASLVLPSDCTTPTVAVLVHGDGPQDRWSNDSYLPLINALVDACIGVFSWDKPGVGESTGNWLDQSMRERAGEAHAAFSFVQSLPQVSAERVGYLGFSQAGWVIPKATTLGTPAFSVIIGAAVNWRDQGRYFTATRLRRDGLSANDIQSIVDKDIADNDRLFTADANASDTVPENITPDRFHFVRRNYSADARIDISNMRGPVAAIWGASDLNVDPVKNSTVYRQTLPTEKKTHVQIVPHATHGLLRARWFNYQTVDEWPVWAKALFIALGRRAWTSSSLESISRWINNTVDQ